MGLVTQVVKSSAPEKYHFIIAHCEILGIYVGSLDCISPHYFTKGNATQAHQHQSPARASLPWSDYFQQSMS